MAQKTGLENQSFPCSWGLSEGLIDAKWVQKLADMSVLTLELRYEAGLTSQMMFTPDVEDVLRGSILPNGLKVRQPSKNPDWRHIS